MAEEAPALPALPAVPELGLPTQEGGESVLNAEQVALCDTLQKLEDSRSWAYKTARTLAEQAQEARERMATDQVATIPWNLGDQDLKFVGKTVGRVEWGRDLTDDVVRLGKQGDELQSVDTEKPESPWTELLVRSQAGEFEGVQDVNLHREITEKELLRQELVKREVLSATSEEVIRSAVEIRSRRDEEHERLGGMVANSTEVEFMQDTLEYKCLTPLVEDHLPNLSRQSRVVTEALKTYVDNMVRFRRATGRQDEAGLAVARDYMGMLQDEQAQHTAANPPTPAQLAANKGVERIGQSGGVVEHASVDGDASRALELERREREFDADLELRTAYADFLTTGASPDEAYSFAVKWREGVPKEVDALVADVTGVGDQTAAEERILATGEPNDGDASRALELERREREFDADLELRTAYADFLTTGASPDEAYSFAVKWREGVPKEVDALVADVTGVGDQTAAEEREVRAAKKRYHSSAEAGGASTMEKTAAEIADVRLGAIYQRSKAAEPGTDLARLRSEMELLTIQSVLSSYPVTSTQAREVLADALERHQGPDNAGIRTRIEFVRGVLEQELSA